MVKFYMKILSHPEADEILAPLDIKIGKWNELSDTVFNRQNTSVILKAPKAAIEIYVIALWLTDWLPKGKWKLIQIDNSTSPSRDESLLFGQLMSLPMGEWDIATQKTFLLDLNDDIAARQQLDMVIVSVIFFALMFQWHIHIVSDGGARGQRLAIQDGFAYFFGNDENISAAKTLVEQVFLHPVNTPKWIEE